MKFTKEEFIIAKEIQDYQVSKRAETKLPPMSIDLLVEMVRCINQLQIGGLIDRYKLYE